MSAHQGAALPLPATPASDHAVDAVTARAVRLGLWPTIDIDAAVTALMERAAGDRRLLERARARVERSLAEEWSAVAARAAGLLTAAAMELGDGDR